MCACLRACACMPACVRACVCACLSVCLSVRSTCLTASYLWRGTGGDRDPSRQVGEKRIRNAPLSPPKGFCTEMGSDVSHFNVSIIASGKIARQRAQAATREEKGESKRGVEPTSVRLPA